MIKINILKVKLTDQVNIMRYWALFKRARTSAKDYVGVSERTYVLVHMHAKGLCEVEYRAEAVVINKYTPSQSHHWSHHFEIAVPITEA